MCVFYVFFFFFKQKTAYEMRISDWSSDVCSSDLYAKGGEAARNCFKAIFEIDDNVKAYGEAVPAIGEAVDAYVSKADGAAKGLYALRDAVRALVKAKLQADDPAAAEDEAKQESEAGETEIGRAHV